MLYIGTYLLSFKRNCTNLFKNVKKILLLVLHSNLQLIEEYPCLIFDPEILLVLPYMERALIPLVKCPRFVYNTTVFTRTIASDWDLVCSKHWLIHVSVDFKRKMFLNNFFRIYLTNNVLYLANPKHNDVGSSYWWHHFWFNRR